MANPIQRVSLSFINSSSGEQGEVESDNMETQDTMSNCTDNDSGEDDDVCPETEEDFEILEPEPISGITLTTQSGGSKMIQRSFGASKVGAIFYPSTSQENEGTKKGRVRHRRTKVYSIPELRPVDSRVDRVSEDFACYVRGPYITFSRSDAKFPPSRDFVDSVKDAQTLSDGTVNFFLRLMNNQPHVLWWKQKIGTWLAREVLKFDNAINRRQLYYLTDFPQNYVLFQQHKGPKGDPRKDVYLESGGRVRQFRSPEEFYEHAAYLMRKKGAGTRPFCLCKYCKAKRKLQRKKAGLTESDLV